MDRRGDFKKFEENWNVKCYNCGKQSYHKGIVHRESLEILFSLGVTHSECPSLLDYAKGVAKAGIGLMNVGQ